MSLTIINHPLQLLSERIEAARTRRDPEAFARLLMGEGVPALSREGDDPAEVIWHCISRYMQPTTPGWFDPLDDILQQQVEQLEQVLAGEVNAVAQVNSPSFSTAAWGAFAKLPTKNWDQHEPYMYNLLLFSSLFPARKGLFGALKHLRDAGLTLPVILHSRAIPMLRTSLMAQQTDDRLVEEWMGQFSEACKDQKLNTRDGRAQALTLWRALLLAPASGEQEFDIDRIRRTLEIAFGNEQKDDDSRMMFVQIALQQMEQLWGGTPQYWRNIFAPETAWPEAIRQIAQDLWPDPQDADAYLTSEDHAFWRRLGQGTRQRIRQAFRSNAAEWNSAFFDLLNDPAAVRQKLQELRQRLQAINPGLAPQKFEMVREADEDFITAEQGEDRLQQQTPVSSYAQYEQVTKQIADIERLLGKRDSIKAFERFQQLIQRQKSSGAADKHLAMTAANVATLFLDSGHKDIAEGIYRGAVDQFPNDKVVHCGLADVLKAQERYVEAETLYIETAERFPNDVVPRNGLAEVYKAQERYAEAELLYRESINRFPNKVVPYSGLAEIFIVQERYAEAEILYRETAGLFPNDVLPRNGLAEVHKAQEHFAKAETLYRESVGLFPNNVVTRCGLADVLKAQERYVEAETLYRETVGLFPNNVVARNGLAGVLKAQERDAEAEVLYLETVRLFPDDAVTYNGLAEVLKAQERYAEAEALYRETVSRFPNDVVARNGLANVLRKLNRLDEAEALLSGRHSSNPERQRYDEVVLALIEVERGLFDKAVRRITDAASRCVPQTPKARLLALAASIELRQNKPQEASALMENVVQANNEAVRLLAWHVTLATSADKAAAIASHEALKLISERAKKIEKSIYDLVNSGQPLCGNDELFEQECDLLAA